MCSDASAYSTTHDEEMRLLVVDDALMNRKLLSRLLSNRGHMVDEAKDGQEGVERVKAAIAENWPYDSSEFKN